MGGGGGGVQRVTPHIPPHWASPVAETRTIPAIPKLLFPVAAMMPDTPVPCPEWSAMGTSDWVKPSYMASTVCPVTGSTIVVFPATSAAARSGWGKPPVSGEGQGTGVGVVGQPPQPLVQMGKAPCPCAHGFRKQTGRAPSLGDDGGGKGGMRKLKARATRRCHPRRREAK